MAMPIMVATSRKPRGPGSNKSSKEYEVLYQGSAGPRELLELIGIQARAAIKGLETGAIEPQNKSASDDLPNQDIFNPTDRNLQQLQTFW
jgi:hypothetical protein